MLSLKVVPYVLYMTYSGVLLLLTNNTTVIIQNQDLAAEAQRAAGLQDELDVAKGYEEKAVSGLCFFFSC